jgi:hypothetical protein
MSAPTHDPGVTRYEAFTVVDGGREEVIGYATRGPDGVLSVDLYMGHGSFYLREVREFDVVMGGVKVTLEPSPM